MLSKLIAVTLIILAIVFFLQKSKNAISNLPFEDKIKLAEEYLEEFKNEGDVFFTKIEKLKASPEQLAQKANEFNDIVRKHIDKQNSLKLPCPTARTTINNPNLRSYISWAKDFEVRDRRIMDDFTRKLKQIFSNAGFR